MTKIRLVLIPIFLTAILIIIFNKCLHSAYEKELTKKDITSIKHQYNHITRDRGGVLKEEMFKEEDLILLGSSELASVVQQNPINKFPFKGAEYDVSILGRGHTQNLQHATILGSTSNIQSDEKVVIIQSLQWYENSGGIMAIDFVVNFSEYQFYKLLNNNKISDENKLYYAKRVAELLGETNQYTEEAIYAKIYAKDNFLSKLIIAIVKPYFSLKEYLLETRDMVQSYKVLKALPDKTDKAALKEINWEEEYALATKQGEEKSDKNELFIDNNYYDTYVKDKYDSYKDKNKDVDLSSSAEFNDYKFFLSICKEVGVKPLIILAPVNAQYYDHIGMNVDKRTEFYNKAEQLGIDQNFDVLNLQNKEHEKYYLFDIMHLGWKGWLNVDEEIYKYYK